MAASNPLPSWARLQLHPHMSCPPPTRSLWSSSAPPTIQSTALKENAANARELAYAESLSARRRRPRMYDARTRKLTPLDRDAMTRRVSWGHNGVWDDHALNPCRGGKERVARKIESEIESRTSTTTLHTKCTARRTALTIRIRIFLRYFCQNTESPCTWSDSQDHWLVVARGVIRGSVGQRWMDVLVPCWMAGKGRRELRINRSTDFYI
jgi:hypothetical protein